DAVEVNRKYLPSLTVSLGVRFIFSANSLPRLRDRSDAIWRRLLLLPFDRVIPESDRRREFTSAGFWAGELPGMFNWALEGLMRLRERHWQFTEPEMCRRAVAAHREECNPAAEFLSDKVTQ